MKSKTILKIIFPIFLIAFIVWNIFPKNNEKETKRQIEEITQKAQQDYADRNDDIDGDGLKNWEEELYQTDPKNQDTDGDGVNDKDEIEQGRSPIVFGSGLDTDLKKLNEQKSLVQNSSDFPVSLEDVEITKSIRTLTDVLVQAGYNNSFDDLVKTQTDKQKQMRSYFNQIAGYVLLASESEGTLNESLFAVYEGKATQKDKEALKSLSSSYKKISQGILSVKKLDFIEVGDSESLGENYLNLANYLNEIIEDSGNYEDSEEFRKKSEKYTKEITLRNKTFVDINSFIKKEGVYFSENDSGRFFMFELGSDI